MADLLIRNINPELKRRIKQRAQGNRRSLSQEAKILIQRGLLQPSEKATAEGRGLGTAMMKLVRPEDRGDDLVFETRGEVNP
jgi:plasmid stability protein